MRKLMTFTIVTCVPGHVLRETAKVEAHFMTGPNHARDRVKFWMKPHWYSFRRCVGVFDWQFVVGIRNELSTNADWLKEAGVKL